MLSFIKGFDNIRSEYSTFKLYIIFHISIWNSIFQQNRVAKYLVSTIMMKLDVGVVLDFFERATRIYVVMTYCSSDIFLVCNIMCLYRASLWHR